MVMCWWVKRGKPHGNSSQSDACQPGFHQHNIPNDIHTSAERNLQHLSRLMSGLMSGRSSRAVSRGCYRGNTIHPSSLWNGPNQEDASWFAK
ncbi:hypothetical protein NQZ68_035332 [Dissostichus eleginoides]|nr:hypothetical protein NQZ68_035332 [Dissostichus eleginoides]